MNRVVNESPAKKPYVAPALTVHGDLRTLTQAGSAATKETKTKTGCSNNLSAAKC